jgi:hypothetical protein
MAVTSIVVRTTCVDRAWHGGCDRSVANCSQAQVNQIGAALDRIYAKVDGCDLTGLRDLKSCIKRADKDVVWNCGSLGDSVVGQTSGNEITLTPTAFGTTQCRFDAIVFHEIVHACGGTELDSEAFENHCYRSCGATAPTSDDFPKFRNDGGRWVNWNGSTGVVTTKDGQTLNVNNSAFVDPSPPSGGGGWF